MDRTQNDVRPQQPEHQYVNPEAHSVHTQPPTHKGHKSPKRLLSLRFGIVVLLFGIGLILVTLVAYITIGHFSNESNYVNKSEYQSVFININGSTGGQAYFGNIVSITSKYIILDNAFYLESGTTSNQFTLNNLSCALYNPEDQMVINRDQVAFWQNLKTNSLVSQDIGKWNSEKLQCSKQTPATTGAPASSGSPATSTPSSSGQ